MAKQLVVSWAELETPDPPKRLYAYSGGVVYDITPTDLVLGRVSGGYAAGGYGKGRPFGIGIYGVDGASVELQEADTWQLDNFGDKLVATFSADGRILSWDHNPANRAVAVAGTPTNCRGLVVTPERFLFALGADGDVRTVRWPSQESLTDWTPTLSNTAGDYVLTTQGRLVTGRVARRQTLLWTDADLHTALYVGGDFIYAFEKQGDDCGLVAPGAVAMSADVAYWMGFGRFFRFDGAIMPLECGVAEYVFGDMNQSQRAKIVAVPNQRFHEITWYYPSGSQTGLENDRYVTYNYRENHWTIGKLPRATGIDRGVFEYPLLLPTDGELFEHERGTDRHGEVPYLESGPTEYSTWGYPRIGSADGERVLSVQRLVPDEKTLGDVQATFFASLYPTDAEQIYGPYSLAAPSHLRFIARQLRVRLQQNVETSWRVGVMRLGVVPGGSR